MFRVLLALVFTSVLMVASTATAAPPVETYGKLPAVEDVSLSPNGERFALIAVDGETRKLIVATVDNKALFQADVGKAKVRGIQWAGNDHLLVTISGTVNLGMDFAVARQELDRVLVINVTTGGTLAVFDKHNEVAHIVVGTYGSAEIAGHWYGYFGGITFKDDNAGGRYLEHTYADLYQVDLDTGALFRVTEGSEIADGWLIGPDGAVIARSTYDESHGDWRVTSGLHGGVVLASGRSPFGNVEMAGLGRTKDHILLRQLNGHGTFDAEIPLAGGEAVEVADDNKIDGLLFDRKTGTWVGYTTFGDIPEPKMFDPLTDARFRGARKAFPDQSVRFDSWSDDFTRMIVFTSGGDDSGTYWMVNIAKGSAEPIGYEYPDVHSDDVGPIRMVDWKAADGMQLHGVLSLPPGRPAKGLPLVVLPHGGPEARDYPVFDWWAQAFASQGYAVFQPNFRGSTGYDMAYYEAGFGEYGGKMQTDISDGIAALAAQGIVDPKRACIVGASYGGYSALVGVTILQGHYRCSVSVAGLSNLSGFANYVGEETGGISAAKRILKTFMGDHDLAQYSPARYANRADAPILLIYGKDDTQVPIDQTLQMQRALQAAGKPVEMVVLPDEDHFLSREATRVTTVKASVDFVEKYNPPDPAPAATTAAK